MGNDGRQQLAVTSRKQMPTFILYHDAFMTLLLCSDESSPEARCVSIYDRYLGANFLQWNRASCVPRAAVVASFLVFNQPRPDQASSVTQIIRMNYM